MESKMKTNEELEQIHHQMKSHLMALINNTFKFEIRFAAARQIIRTDYHTVDMTTFQAILPFAIVEDTLHIMIDTATPKKVYYQIIDNIYAAKKLPVSLKESTKKRSANSTRNQLTKEQKLLFLIEINYLHTYKNMSQVEIGRYIEQHHIAGIKKFEEYEESKDISRFIVIIKTIKRTTDKISPDEYLA